jgi:hypothetical protein
MWVEGIPSDDCKLASAFACFQCRRCVPAKNSGLGRRFIQPTATSHLTVLLLIVARVFVAAGSVGDRVGIQHPRIRSLCHAVHQGRCSRRGAPGRCPSAHPSGPSGVAPWLRYFSVGVGGEVSLWQVRRRGVRASRQCAGNAPLPLRRAAALIGESCSAGVLLKDAARHGRSKRGVAALLTICIRARRQRC